MRLTLVLLVTMCLVGCSGDDNEASNGTAGADASSHCEGADNKPGCPPKGPALIRQFPDYNLKKFEEVSPCMAWTLHNEKALYVQAVTLFNKGAFHHSNWFVVPEEMYDGPDGFFNCKDRKFEEVASAIAGTVLYAQSTQAYVETQKLPKGVVIKIPPKHRIIGSAHLLNLSVSPKVTSARLTLDLVHPRDVKTVVAPFRLGYWDLKIPANKESRHTGECPLADDYKEMTGQPLDMKLYYVLPHYHALGNYFRLEVMGGPHDGKKLVELSGFNAEANGVVFDPPFDLTGATGLRVTCGFKNNTNKQVGWGIGDQEMCEFLGLADTRVMMDGGVNKHNKAGKEVDGIINYVSKCSAQAVAKNAKQSMPTTEEIEAELYKPESDAGKKTLVAIDGCKDTDPKAAVTGPATLESIRETVFKPSCSYNACHGGSTAQMGLDLTVKDLRGALVGKASKQRPDMDLVTPGDPQKSWLYHSMSKCNPAGKSGPVSHMPLNSPELLETGLVAKVRKWIEDGAKD